MAVGSFPELVLLSFFIGFSIFLSLPFIFAGRSKTGSMIILTSVAIGILIFLVADIFSDVAGMIYPADSYIANPVLSLTFVIAAGGAFLFLYLIERRGTLNGNGGNMRTALIVAAAIGFQNLTEGLVFGSAWNVGFTGLLSVIFIGFVFQNFTEGFPIVSPFFGSKETPRMLSIATLFLIGAFPTIIGSLAGYYFTSSLLNIIFDALAMGTILYIIMPMLSVLFRHGQELKKKNVVYLGILAGFLLGFLVNAF